MLFRTHSRHILVVCTSKNHPQCRFHKFLSLFLLLACLRGWFVCVDGSRTFSWPKFEFNSELFSSEGNDRTKTKTKRKFFMIWVCDKSNFVTILSSSQSDDNISFVFLDCAQLLSHLVNLLDRDIGLLKRFAHHLFDAIHLCFNCFLVRYIAKVFERCQIHFCALTTKVANGMAIHTTSECGFTSWSKTDGAWCGKWHWSWSCTPLQWGY